MESKLRKIPVPKLITRIISDYVEWDRRAVNAGWIVFLKYPLKELLETVDKKTLFQIAIRTADFTKHTRISMTGNNNLPGFFKILINRSKRSGFRIIKSNKDGNTTFTILHGMGQKWSMFHKSMYGRILNNLGYESKIQYTDDTLIIKVKTKRHKLS